MLTSSYLFFPNLLFYSIGLGIICYTVKFRVFSTKKLSQITNKQRTQLKIFLFLFSFVFASIFTQLYRPLTITFNQNSSLIDSLVLFLIIGSISYLTLNNIIKYLLDKDTENIKRKTIYNYSVFILSILLFSTIFATQSLGVISSNEYQISEDNIRAMEITSDFSELIYLVQHSQANYLVDKNLETGKTTVYSLCEKGSVQVNGFFPDIDLCISYYSDIGKLWFSQQDKKVFIEVLGSYRSIYVFDLNKGKFVDVYPYAFYYNYKPVFWNNSLYIASESYINQTSYIHYWNHYVDYFIPFAYPNNTELNSFSVSPDLSKLTIAFTSYSSSKPSCFINFYNLIDLKPVLIRNITIPDNYFSSARSLAISYDGWNDNSTILYYTLYNYKNSTIFSFNYENSLNTKILGYKTFYRPFSISKDNSLLVLNNPMQVYSLNSEPNLLVTKNFNFTLWDSSYSQLIALDQGRIKLMSYIKETHLLNEEKILDSSFSDKDLYIYDVIQYLLTISTVIALVITIISYKRVEKWKWIWKSPFKTT